MKYFTVILFYFLLINFVSAQHGFENEISGKVTDQSDGMPLVNVNVYLSGTTIGTVTDSNGRFKIKSVPPSGYELVCSIIGYETFSKDIFLKGTTVLDIPVSLRQKTYEMNQVEIITSIPEEWRENFRIFSNYFLGRNRFAADCIIENAEYLNFSVSEKELFTARINRPLIILNKALGYKLSCELVNFSYDPDEGRLRYLVRPFFTEMLPEDEDDVEYWEENRISAYLGSQAHFFSSLIKNNFSSEGYRIQHTRIPFEKGMNEYRRDIWASDSLIMKGSEPNEYILHFPGYLQVIYREGGSGIKKVSWIKLFAGEATLDEFGYPREVLPFEIIGDWSYSGIADMLPTGYRIRRK